LLLSSIPPPRPPPSTLFPYTTLFRSPRRPSSPTNPQLRPQHPRLPAARHLCSSAAQRQRRPRGARPPHRHRQSRCRCAAELHRRSEEHTSELQSQSNLVCRPLLEKKK